MSERTQYKFLSDNSFDKKSVLKIIGTLGIIGSAGIVLYGVSLFSAKAFSVTANLFLLASAFMLGGALIGLLFGIPKSQLNKDEKEGISENTNLEEVSDWLTKIIIGFGIAELSNIQSAVVSSSAFFKNILPDTSEAIIIGIIIYFPVYGFISGWLLTRVHLTELFASLREKISENVTAIETIIQRVKDNSEFDTNEDIVPSLDSSDDINELVSNVRFLEQNDYQLDWETYNKLGLILSSKRNYGLAGQFFKKSYELSKDPKPKVNYGVTYSRGFGRPKEAIKIFKEVITEHKDHKIVARAYYNLACAYAREDKKQEAIDALKEAINLNDEYLDYAEQDTAFQVLAEEKDFKELVPEYKPKTDHHFGE